ncbi:hypothetical protein BLNAU_3579 [Blattamonas nauphoetae]|uniref:Uncharacterized protein n=1 Tax=Blattamonas nauphoetae TaxID=2049346 RepID=A0ABQ9YCF7_9EUKA|nr:hypothetical protein BLNAU_3579 [Blattamonas nauphoetae]
MHTESQPGVNIPSRTNLRFHHFTNDTEQEVMRKAPNAIRLRSTRRTTVSKDVSKTNPSQSSHNIQHINIPIPQLLQNLREPDANTVTTALNTILALAADAKFCEDFVSSNGIDSLLPFLGASPTENFLITIYQIFTYLDTAVSGCDMQILHSGFLPTIYNHSQSASLRLTEHVYRLFSNIVLNGSASIDTLLDPMLGGEFHCLTNCILNTLGLVYANRVTVSNINTGAEEIAFNQNTPLLLLVLKCHREVLRLTMNSLERLTHSSVSNRATFCAANVTPASPDSHRSPVLVLLDIIQPLATSVMETRNELQLIHNFRLRRDVFHRRLKELTLAPTQERTLIEECQEQMAVLTDCLVTLCRIFVALSQDSDITKLLVTTDTISELLTLVMVLVDIFTGKSAKTVEIQFRQILSHLQVPPIPEHVHRYVNLLADGDDFSEVSLEEEQEVCRIFDSLFLKTDPSSAIIRLLEKSVRGITRDVVAIFSNIACESVQMTEKVIKAKPSPWSGIANDFRFIPEDKFSILVWLTDITTMRWSIVDYEVLYLLRTMAQHQSGAEEILDQNTFCEIVHSLSVTQWKLSDNKDKLCQIILLALSLVRYGQFETLSDIRQTGRAIGRQSRGNRFLVQLHQSGMKDIIEGCIDLPELSDLATETLREIENNCTRLSCFIRSDDILMMHRSHNRERTQKHQQKMVFVKNAYFSIIKDTTEIESLISVCSNLAEKTKAGGLIKAVFESMPDLSTIEDEPTIAPNFKKEDSIERMRAQFQSSVFVHIFLRNVLSVFMNHLCSNEQNNQSKSTSLPPLSSIQPFQPPAELLDSLSTQGREPTLLPSIAPIKPKDFPSNLIGGDARYTQQQSWASLITFDQSAQSQPHDHIDEQDQSSELTDSALFPSPHQFMHGRSESPLISSDMFFTDPFSEIGEKRFKLESSLEDDAILDSESPLLSSDELFPDPPPISSRGQAPGEQTYAFPSPEKAKEDYSYYGSIDQPALQPLASTFLPSPSTRKLHIVPQSALERDQQERSEKTYPFMPPTILSPFDQSNPPFESPTVSPIPFLGHDDQTPLFGSAVLNRAISPTNAIVSSQPAANHNTPTRRAVIDLDWFEKPFLPDSDNPLFTGLYDENPVDEAFRNARRREQKGT